MNIFITNLKTSKDRRTFMVNQLSKLNLNYNFVDCVVGADLTDEEISRSCDMEAIHERNSFSKVHWFSKGVIGCTMTNQNNYKNIIEKNLPYALLLEDDTVLPPNLKEILDHIETFIKQGDVILLFWMSWTPLKIKRAGIASPFNHEYFIPENPKLISGGSAMIVTQKAAAKMLEENTPIHLTPDAWGYYLEKGCIDRILCCYPYCIETADFKSTMQAGKFNSISNFVDQYKLFPLYQIFKIRRKMLKRKKQNIIIE